jgi:hypothetical protein
VGKYRFLGYALALTTWTIGAPFALIVLDAVARGRGSPFPCPICGSRGLECPHRALAQAVLHVIGVLVLVRLWWRTPEGDPPLKPGLTDMRPLAVLECLTMGVGLALEAGSTDSVVATGPIALVLGCILVSPTGNRGTRFAGWSALASVLVGFYAVVCFQWGPPQAGGPLFVIGLIGLALCLTGTIAAFLPPRT